MILRRSWTWPPGTTLEPGIWINFPRRHYRAGTTTGYVLNYDPQQSAGAAVSFNSRRRERGAGRSTLATAPHPAGWQTLSLVLTAVGSDFTAQVYD